MSCLYVFGGGLNDQSRIFAYPVLLPEVASRTGDGRSKEIDQLR